MSCWLIEIITKSVTSSMSSPLNRDKARQARRERMKLQFKFMLSTGWSAALDSRLYWKLNANPVSESFSDNKRREWSEVKSRFEPIDGSLLCNNVEIWYEIIILNEVFSSVPTLCSIKCSFLWHSDWLTNNKQASHRSNNRILLMLH